VADENEALENETPETRADLIADEDRLARLGAFIRDRRGQARLSLRKLSEQAGISNPYLSQIERGLRKPSAEILQSIARALRISAETLYVQAGILEDRGEDRSVSAAIYADATITERQKQVLVDVYESFRLENVPAGEDRGEGGSDN